LASVHDRHPEIGEHEADSLGTGPLQEPKRARSILGLDYFVAFVLQQPANTSPKRGLVFDDQDSRTGAGGDDRPVDGQTSDPLRAADLGSVRWLVFRRTS
jgi:hypothetical protein